MPTFNAFPALSVRGPTIADNTGNAMRMMNMMAQQQAAQRQAQQAQQSMDIAAAQEARAARLAEPQYEKATYDAQKAFIATAADFNNFIRVSSDYAQTPQQARDIAAKIAALPQFQAPIFQQSIETALQNLPDDPALFPEWKDNIAYQTLASDQKLSQELKDLTTGSETFTMAIPKYRGSGVAPAEVPGTRQQAPQGITYIKTDQGIVPMPSKTSGGGPGAPAPAGGGGPVAAALKTNPGALKDGAFARSQPGYAGASGGFAMFETPEAGIAAQENLLRSAYVGKGFNTIDKIINRYAPEGRENSAASVANYKSYISQQTGIDVNKPLAAADVPVVAKAMREFETGQRPGGSPLGAVIPGTAPKKDLTAQEQTASYNIKRLLRAAQTIKEAVGRSADANAPGALEAFVGSTPIISGLVNFTRGEDRQIVSAAQRDMLDSLLYLATGAAYNKEQLEGQAESYLPQYSDGPKARESKRTRLAQLVRDAKSRAGAAWTPDMDTAVAGLFDKAPAASRATPPSAPKNAAAKPPPGVSAEDWKYMTPQERALWRK